MTEMVSPYVTVDFACVNEKLYEMGFLLENHAHLVYNEKE